MPTRVEVIAATAEIAVVADNTRTILVIQNNDAANAMRVSDVQGGGAAGIILEHGDYLELNQAIGWNTERSWYLYSLLGVSEVVIHEGSGKQTITIRSERAPITPTSPLQEPGHQDPAM